MMLAKRIQRFLLGLDPALSMISRFLLRTKIMECDARAGRGSALINAKETSMCLHAEDRAMEKPKLSLVPTL